MIGLGRRAAVKTFTRNNNKSIRPRNGRQATTLRSPHVRLRSLTLTSLTLLVSLLAILGFSTSSAFAESAWWKLNTTSTPTYLTPGSEAYVTVEASNLGDGPALGNAIPIKLATTLPSWLEPTRVEGVAGPEGYTSRGVYGTLGSSLFGPMSCVKSFAAGQPVSCEYPESLPPFGTIELIIKVKVLAGAPASSSDEASETTIEGGDTPGLSSRQKLMTGSSTPFGVEGFELVPESEGGAPDTQAGSHPFQLTNTLNLNAEAEPAKNLFAPAPHAPELPKDLNIKLPQGLVGNANLLPQCSEVAFTSNETGDFNPCPASSAVGVALVTLNEPFSLLYKTAPEPIFNLTPAPGEPARFGFTVEGVPVVLDTAVRTGSDYGITVSVNNLTEVDSFVRSEVTFWGVPGAASHDASRGWSCIAGGIYVAEGAPPEACDEHETSPKGFLTLPSSCTSPLQSGIEMDSWDHPGAFTQPQEYTLANSAGTALELTGCNKQSFEPTISVAPDGQAASTPSGLTVGVHIPQEISLSGAGIAASDVKDINVTLPEGVTLNPSGADGLQACSDGLIGYLPGQSPESNPQLFTSGEQACPNASKIGEVAIKTPLLSHELEGSVYLASQDENPFGSLIAMYIVAKDPVSGVLVKLPGEVKLNASTGRIEASILNNPEVPFEEAKLHFFGGERAPLASPAYCSGTAAHPGPYTTEASFTPWSGGAPVVSKSSFEITSGPNGTACPGTALPFSPSLTGGMTNINAGAFSPLTTTIGREDGQQNINQVQLKMPPGLSGILSGVPLCGEAQANAGTCGEASKIGSTIVSVGLGGDPYSVTGGRVYLTGPYQGAPFGLSIVNPAVAGPFNLGNVVVRAKIEVNPTTAALTVTTNSEAEGYAIPHILQGIPLQIKHINVTIERPGFTFNPTNCTPASITSTIGSVEGASSTASTPFQVTNCATLKFAPKFAVSTPGHTSKADGAGLTAKLSYPVAAQGTQADIKAVKVDLPQQLPSRLTTLQKACTSKQFETNPANCPKASKIGFAKVSTPLLPVPLEGPAIFVSHGGEAFPSLTMVLQGYGVTVDLVGTTYISHAGITSTTFKTVPDVPFNTFELTLGQGPYSALAANLPTKDKGNFCGQTLTMPTAFVAQNGLEIHDSTKISVSGCPKSKKAGKSKSKKKGKRTKKK
jgi:hypothetical protein